MASSGTLEFTKEFLELYNKSLGDSKGKEPSPNKKKDEGTISVYKDQIQCRLGLSSL